MAEYAEFKLKLERAGTPMSYRIEASGPSGDAQMTFELPFTTQDLEVFILRVGRTRRGVRRIESPEMELARKFGGTLFQAVMSGAIGTQYRTTVAAAQALKQGVRVTVSTTAAPELGQIPWEFLFDDPDFLSTSWRTPVVRYLEVAKPQRPLEITLPIKILAVISAPTDAAELQTSVERERLERALAPLIARGAVHVDWLENATLLALNQKVRSAEYHILHFIGHGGFDGEQGALLFEDGSGRSRIVSGDQVASVLRDRDSLRLVVLNSCEGARSSLDDPFSGVAASLIERQVPAVIGMQFEITDRAAILFAQEFYTVLAEGRPVDTAVAEARLAIYADQNDVEWATPALFMRVTDGHLFAISDAVPLPREEVELPPKEPPPEERGPAPGPGPEARTPAPTDDAAAEERIPPPSSLAERLRLLPKWAWALGALGLVAIVGVLGALLVFPGDTASLSASETPGRPGYVSAVATGFAPGELVEFRVNDSHEVVARERADEDGGATAEFPVGSESTGSLHARGVASRREAEATYAIGAANASTGPASSLSSAPPSGPASGPPPSDATSTPPGSPPSGILAGTPGDCGTPAAPWIVFDSDRMEVNTNGETDEEIYCIDPDNPANIRQLTNNHPSEGTQIDSGHPAWSPDYRDIVYTHELLKDSQPVDRDIYFLRADGTVEPRIAEPTDDFFPSWSVRDELAFVRDGAAIVTVASGIRVSPAQAATPTPQVQPTDANGVVRAPSWDIDGSRIAYHTQEGETQDFDIGIVEPGRRHLIIPSPGVTQLNPSWSPIDRDVIVFVQGQPGERESRDIYQMNVATGQLLDGGSPIADSTGQAGNPRYSPTGDRVVFYELVGDRSILWLVDLKSGAQTELLNVQGGFPHDLDANWR